VCSYLLFLDGLTYFRFSYEFAFFVVRAFFSGLLLLLSVYHDEIGLLSFFGRSCGWERMISSSSI